MVGWGQSNDLRLLTHAVTGPKRVSSGRVFLECVPQVMCLAILVATMGANVVIQAMLID